MFLLTAVEPFEPHDPVASTTPPSVSDPQVCVVILPKSATALPLIAILAFMVVGYENVFVPDPAKERL